MRTSHKLEESIIEQNIRLRELVKDMRKCLSDECKRCHEWGDVCDLDESLRDLGIEVDDEHH